MENKLILSVLVLAALVIAIGTAVMLDQYSSPTGNVVKNSQADFVEIGKGDLVKCCDIPGSDGCFALKSKGCGYCNDYCG